MRRYISALTLNIEAAEGIHPKQWWLWHGGRWHDLQPLAVKGHSCGTVASPCERNWSDWKYIYNQRYPLGITKGSKLVYVYSNSIEMARLNGATRSAVKPFVPWGYMGQACAECLN